MFLCPQNSHDQSYVLSLSLFDSPSNLCFPVSLTHQRVPPLKASSSFLILAQTESSKSSRLDNECRSTKRRTGKYKGINSGTDVLWGARGA